MQKEGPLHPDFSIFNEKGVVLRRYETTWELYGFSDWKFNICHHHGVSLFLVGMPQDASWEGGCF